MTEVEKPGEVYLELPYSGSAETYPVPVLTALFREGSYLPMSARLARERAGGEPTGFVSVGCSTGAEVDSLLALHNRYGSDRELSAVGIDINKEVLTAAKEGSYTLKKTFFSPSIRPQQEMALTDMGFGVDFVPTAATNFHGLLGLIAYRARVKAAPVREGHDTRFIEHDATEPLPLTEGVDLVLANNVLYHLSDDRAGRIVRNMATVLSDRGIMTLGGNTLGADSPLETERIVAMLEKEFDMQPLFTDSRGTPVIFGRT